MTLKSILKKPELSLDEPVDEDLLIEERRRKRQLILEKYASEARQTDTNTPTTLNITNNNKEELNMNNKKPPPKIDKTEEIKDSSNPTVQTKAIQEDTQTKVDQPKVQVEQEKEFDMFQDDMFGDEPIQPSHILDAAPIIRASNNPALTDNWDDADGYYNIILGEILNDRYHVFEKLGSGVFSCVVKANDTLTNQVCAIKIIRNNTVMHQSGKTEAKILNRLKTQPEFEKKHIIKLIDEFEHKQHLCLVFECLALNLRQLLKKFGKNQGINLLAVRQYAKQLFLSLSVLEKEQILHADIKPDNIVVNKANNILKLCDFGSASHVNENDITPYLVSRFYRAPEIIIGMKYGPPLDVWSVACTLYELYTGKILFPGKTNNHMLKLMMELKGKFPKAMLRKGTLTHNHFNDNLDFNEQGVDKISSKPFVRTVTNIPIKSLSQKLKPKEQSEIDFCDFLDNCLNLAPEKRMTVKEAFQHPFFLNNYAK